MMLHPYVRVDVPFVYRSAAELPSAIDPVNTSAADQSTASEDTSLYKYTPGKAATQKVCNPINYLPYCFFFMLHHSLPTLFYLSCSAFDFDYYRQTSP